MLVTMELMSNAGSVSSSFGETYANSFSRNSLTDSDKGLIDANVIVFLDTANVL